MDRTEKLTITRSLTATIVKLVVVESGVTVSYSVKTYETQIPNAIRTVHEGANKLLKLAQEGM